MNNLNLIDNLSKNQDTSDESLSSLILCTDNETENYLFHSSDLVRKSSYSDKVFIRGLIEISNYCKNDCFYCGIRASNASVKRFRLSCDKIFASCKKGYALGFRTFVLQGGEDVFFTDDVLCPLITKIKATFKDCAVTLSLGERPIESYNALYKAGADRYLLRHETADLHHYGLLHPNKMSGENRFQCLENLKKIGFQTGAGFMVASPYQNDENLVADLRFLQKLKPEMVGIGPFLRAKNTPFYKASLAPIILHLVDNDDEKRSSDYHKLHLTLRLIAITRLILPSALLPATTALATLSPDGRHLGLQAGCNVIMPNLSPKTARGKYSIYDNKLYTGAESADDIAALSYEVASYGYKIVVDRGDFLSLQ